MRKIILFPASGRIAQDHYKKLVEEGVRININVNETIKRNELLRLWGTTNGVDGSNSRKFRTINENDIAFFVYKDKIISYAQILCVLPHNKEIARQAIQDDSWENIIILSRQKETEISLKDINECIGYRPNYRVQRFNVLDEGKSRKIIEKFQDKLDFERLNEVIEESRRLNEYISGNMDIFISYSHMDEEYKDELKKHLSILKEDYDVVLWDDRELGIGENFDDMIREKIDNSKIIIVLISADYFDSDYCMHKEWAYIKKEHKDKIIPVILRDCLWNVMLDGINTITLPQNGGNIFESGDRDREYRIIAEKILATIMDIRKENA